MYLEPHDYWIYYVNIGLRHQYGISAAESKMFLLAKRPWRRRARRNECFCRLVQKETLFKILIMMKLKQFQRLKASEAHLHQTSLEGHPPPLPESGLKLFDGILHVKCAHRGGRYSTKFYTGRLCPEVHPLYPFIYHFRWKKEPLSHTFY